MIAIVDYGMGNLHSMAKAVEHIGAVPLVTGRGEDLRAAERIILPGVGAFGEAIENLRRTQLVSTLEEEVLVQRKPFLGVCVGMQLLAREGYEHGVHCGLGWLDATVEPLPGDGSVRIPHTGWNEIELRSGDVSPLAGIRSGECFYFNHSFRLVPRSPEVIAAWTVHGERFAAAVALGNLVATQFHPEKSQRAGVEFLAAFVDWKPLAASESPGL